MLPFSDPLNRRILVVDDDPAVRNLVSGQIRSLGYPADAAGSTARAKSLAAAHGYDLVVTDLLMPGSDGSQLIAELGSASPITSFVVMTGLRDLTDYGSTEVNERITGVLNKPFDIEALESAIVHAFEVVETRRALSVRPGSSVRVLLLEDSAPDAFLVEHALKQLGGFECVRVSRLADAVALLHDETFDTLITDLSLPDARGLDAVLKLRQCSPNATLIVRSGAADDALALRVIELGAQDFIVKGLFDGEAIGRAIRFARVRRQGEQRLARLAYSDALTGLWNRAVFAERLDHALSQARRHATRLGVIYVDLDGFKAVNDERGHDSGDQLLRQVASRLRACVRDYDVVSRLGGDEFAVLTTHLAKGALVATAERVASSIARPMLISGESLHVTASIGVAAFPDHAEDAVLLMKLADEAMYQSKRAGKNQVQEPGSLGKDS